MPPNEWTYGKEHKLFNNVIIVDEFSMVDVRLFKRLIDAIDFERTKLLIIGDNAQLPSVGCGNLLHDFMQTNIIPTITLTKVFRYNENYDLRRIMETHIR
jgi:exodeoxyribonuclease V alpha subunit